MAVTRSLFLGLGGILLLVVTTSAQVVVEPADPTAQRLRELNSITGNDAISATIVKLMKDPAGTKTLLAAARELAKGKKKEEVLNVNATLILARAAHAVKDYTASEQFYRLNIEQAQALESGQKMVVAYGGLVGMLLEAKKFEEAEKVYKEFNELEAGENVERIKETLRRRMAMILARQGQLEKANELVDGLMKDDPGNPLNLELKGRVLQEAGKFEEAATTYEKLIVAVQNNRRLPKDLREEFINDIRYRLSSVYVDLKQIDKAAEALKTLIEKQPDNPTYYNDLGFIWADHDMNLDEAEKFIRKALDLDREERKKAPDFNPATDKENPSYLDSMGWVLYKKKQYPEARKYLQQALEQEEGRHLEIYDHLGDCLMKLGEKKEAIEAWKKGLEVTSDSPRDKIRKVNVEKKLKDAEK